MSASNPTVAKGKKTNWFVQLVTSTIGRKIIMGLTGLFLILFLVVHLIGNLQLLYSDGGEAFNKYAQFMGHNELIQIVSKANFFFILLHVVIAILLTSQNTKARPTRYKYSKPGANSAWSSRNMMILGSILFIFLVVHIQGFYWRSKFGEVPMVSYDGFEYQNLYVVVKEAFAQWWIVVLYVLGMAALAFHLVHGFQSAFQTVGVNHVKYNQFIKTVGIVFSILVPVAFAVIPIYMFLSQLPN